MIRRFKPISGPFRALFSTRVPCYGRQDLVQKPESVIDFGGYWRSGEPVEPIPLDAAKKSTILKTLHARLNLSQIGGDSSSGVPLTTLAQALICASAKSKFVDNVGMASFGQTLLEFYVYEYFMATYPRLPPPVLTHVSDLYTGTNALAIVGKSWGVVEDTRPPLARYLAEESEEDLLGKLRYTPDNEVIESGVIEIKSPNSGNKKKSSSQDILAAATRINRKGAMASFVRATVAGVYAHGGLDSTKEFTYSYIIRPKKVDMESILTFEQPTRELARLCAREGLSRPISRLMVESGRFTSHPVFVVGAFSDETKLGEGQGASLAEAKTRAAVNALKSWYLYSPVERVIPSSDVGEGSDGEFKPVHVDKGQVVF